MAYVRLAEAREHVGEEEVEAVRAWEIEEVELHVLDTDRGEGCDLLGHLVGIATDDMHFSTVAHGPPPNELPCIVRDRHTHVAGRHYRVRVAPDGATVLVEDG